ncbi:stathmin-4-like [Ictidomys tridecemlineatus]
MTLTAYKEKMEELPLVSLFFSCFLADLLNKSSYIYEGWCGKPCRRKDQSQMKDSAEWTERREQADTRDLNWCIILDMEVIELNKCTSG